MRTSTQGLVTAVLGVVLIRVAWTGEYLRYVQPWMHWPLIVTGVVLLAMAARPALELATAEHRVPASSWLLLLPTAVILVVAPPSLGAFLAENRTAQDPATLRAPASLPPSPGDGPLELGVDEFAWGAVQDGDPMRLEEQEARMTGFVSAGDKGSWYVTRLVIFCCAADATVVRVRVLGKDAPPRDQWVQVTGRLAGGAGTTGVDGVAIDATEVKEVPAPETPYG